MKCNNNNHRPEVGDVAIEEACAMCDVAWGVAVLGFGGKNCANKGADQPSQIEVARGNATGETKHISSLIKK